MNFDDIIRQQQNMYYAWSAIAIAGMLLSGFILYMFYARLRDIADELRKFRIAYEIAEDKKTEK